MPRRRRTEKAIPHAEIADGLMAYLTDEPIPDLDSETKFAIILLEAGDCEALREVWNRARGEVLGAWLKDHPGTRPAVWWRFDAPRQPMGRWPDCFWDGRLCEPRGFISGAGCDASLISAYMPSFAFGLPACWAGYEEENPPTFESQASCLQRYGLLTAGEKKVLTADDYSAVEALSAECEVLSTSEKWVRERIPAARRTMGFHDVEQAQPY